MKRIPIYGGYVWINQIYYDGIPMRCSWGAHRSFSRLPDNIRDAAIDSENAQIHAFAGPKHHVLGKGYIECIKIQYDGSGSYEFRGIDKPTILSEGAK